MIGRSVLIGLLSLRIRIVRQFLFLFLFGKCFLRIRLLVRVDRKIMCRSRVVFGFLVFDLSIKINGLYPLLFR